MKTLRGRKAIITGGAGGIGRAITLALAREGVDCCLFDIDAEGMASTLAEASQLGVATLGIHCDMTDSAAISRAVAEYRSAWGTLHVLVNNAGIACYGFADQLSAEQWNRVLAINLLAPIQLTREFLALLLAQEESHIVNLGSLASHVALRKLAPYNVSKFGILGLSESLRSEYGRSSMGVTALCPGFVETGIYDAAEYAPGGSRKRPPRWVMTTPEKVAQSAIRAIRRNQPLVVMTALAHTLCFFKRLSPSLFLRLFCGRHKRTPASE